jgi:hypothetical protein
VNKHEDKGLLHSTDAHVVNKKKINGVKSLIVVAERYRLIYCRKTDIATKIEINEFKYWH